MSERYAVWRVYYDTYENVARDGDKPQERVSDAMPYERALARLGEFMSADNYRFCIKPFGEA